MKCRSKNIFPDPFLRISLNCALIALDCCNNKSITDRQTIIRLNAIIPLLRYNSPCTCSRSLAPLGTSGKTTTVYTVDLAHSIMIALSIDSQLLHNLPTPSRSGSASSPSSGRLSFHPTMQRSAISNRLFDSVRP